MRYPGPGRHRQVEDFRAELRSIDPAMDCDLELEGADGPLGRPIELGGRTLTNRFCAHPMEGWDGTEDGLPTEHTLRRWRNFGRSGAQLIWGGEAFAVQRDGRANPNQLYLEPAADSAGGLAALREEVFAGHREAGGDPERLYLGLQLTHSGRWARPDARGPAPRVASHHPVLDGRFAPQHGLRELTDSELEGIGESYVRAAKLARECGFDFVDLKSCHGYLVHELLGARFREGPYGGSFENRTRFLRRLIEEVRAACPGLEIGVRISAGDLFPFSVHPDTGVGEPLGCEDHLPYLHGFGVDPDDPSRIDLTEPLMLLRLLRDLDIRLVNVSLGSPYYTHHLLRPAAYPPSDGYEPPENPLVGVARHVETVRRCKRAFPDLILVGSGYTYLQEWVPHVAQRELRQGNVDFVGLGRMMLTYPELCRHALEGRPLDRRRICRTFSDCTTAPRNGLISGCYPLDPHYGELPEAERVRELRKKRR